MPVINVIGAGLAGCEAAYQAAKMGVRVKLHEMKPQKYTPAHNSPLFAELVCSNSLRSNQTSNAVGLLKAELMELGSLIMESAYKSQVPAGSALAVDRNCFSEYITEKVKNHKNIEVLYNEVTSIPDDEITIIATGPLTSDLFSDYIGKKIGANYLHFFDAAAPIVDASTINMDKAFLASRYGKGEASYVNCPMTKDEYDIFYKALVSAKESPLKDFDRESQKQLIEGETMPELKVFEGCMPVEVMAKRGYETLLFGPLKPVGLPLPDTGKEAYAVVQLRQENIEKTMYNLVGFQTHLTFDEQRKVIRLIPGLEDAEILRYGVMHRNTFINSPELLTATYSVKNMKNIFFAGQITGVEGYVESTSSGFVAGLNAARAALSMPEFVFGRQSIIGALSHYVNSGSASSFQPMNANFGIIEPLNFKFKGKKAARNEQYAIRSLEYINEIKNILNI